MSKQTLLKRLSRNGNEEECNEFLESLNIDDIVDRESEVLGEF